MYQLETLHVRTLFLSLWLVMLDALWKVFFVCFLKEKGIDKKEVFNLTSYQMRSKKR